MSTIIVRFPNFQIGIGNRLIGEEFGAKIQKNILPLLILVWKSSHNAPKMSNLFLKIFGL